MTQVPNSRPPLMYCLRALVAGYSLTRTYLNWETRKHVLFGTVLDLGAGATLDYHQMVRKDVIRTDVVDQKLDGVAGSIDLENDTLPYTARTYEIVLAYNLLEHIYHARHVLNEASRVLKPGGELIGFVPFLMPYHPDPHDYFRYTHEAIKKCLKKVHFMIYK